MNVGYMTMHILTFFTEFYDTIAAISLISNSMKLVTKFYTLLGYQNEKVIMTFGTYTQGLHHKDQYLILFYIYTPHHQKSCLAVW